MYTHLPWAVLLRALEYYRGTIFLTTNRIGVMDEAFTSRIHVSFGFPDLTQHDRERIWMNNFRRLEKDTDMEISDTAKEYIKTTKIGSLPWNGRHIRNGEKADPLTLIIRLIRLEFSNTCIHASVSNGCCPCGCRQVSQWKAVDRRPSRGCCPVVLGVRRLPERGT